jgi:hypothetical protein
MRHRLLLAAALLCGFSFGTLGCDANPDAPKAPSAGSVPQGTGEAPKTDVGKVPPSKKTASGASAIER